ncbi:MAG TPA: ATP-binding protein [Oligoflexus sp.]|uniref:ATP-binding protein n=1 Tax=Oligoflexus sp. TaxID=1971216 RepID=UPI002D419488|nr:ATP-binding protein [Oligoflexus sp.]HYX36278.1 ATP-binding protein [Oligoflexus sp.]
MLRACSKDPWPLGKLAPKVLVNGGNYEFTQDGARLLSDVLVHITRNSMDHGLEMPLVRQSKGKAAAGQIEINLEPGPDESLLLIYRDDGQGLGLDSILKKARAEGLLNSDDQPEPMMLAQFIFAGSFSTRQEVSKNSGRGVGMSAVQHTLKSHGGSIRIDLLEDCGIAPTPFQFVLTLPKQFYSQAVDWRRVD